MAEKAEGAVGDDKIETKQSKKGKRRKRAKKHVGARTGTRGSRVAFPKDALSKCFRIPQAILDQNAGDECTDREAAGYAKIGWTGPVGVEMKSGNGYGLLERPSPGKVKPTDLVRKVYGPRRLKTGLTACATRFCRPPS